MPDLSQFGTPAAATPPPQGGTQDLSQFGTPAAVAPASPATPQQAEQQPGFWQQFQDNADPLTSMNIGAVKGAGQTIAGITELADKYVIPKSMVKSKAAAENIANWLRQNTQTHGFWQGAGSGVEGGAELLAPELWEGEALKALSFGDRLMSMGQKAKLLEKYPGLARVLAVATKGGQEAVKQGALAAGQTYVKTGGDTDQAETSGLIGGVLGGGVGAGAESINQVRDYLKDAGIEVMPVMRNIGGKIVTVLRSELKGPNGESLATPLQEEAAQISGQGAMRATRQAQNKELLRDLSKTASAKLAEDANAARPVPPAVESRSARLLPPPGDTPASFTQPTSNADPQWTRTQPSPAGTNVVEPQTVPNPAFEAPEGELTQEPGQTVEQAAKSIGTQATAVPERSITGPEPVDTRNAAQARLDAAPGAPPRMVLGPETVTADVPRHIPPAAGTGAGPELAGGGTRVFNSVDEMQAERTRLQALLSEQNGPATQTSLRAQLADINRQLEPYDRMANQQPHFPPVDRQSMIDNTSSFADTASHADALAQAKLRRLNPKQQASVMKLENQRLDLQNQFVNAAGDPQFQQKIAGQIKDLDDVAEQTFTGPDMANKISLPEARQMVHEMRVRDSFQALNDAFEKNFNLSEGAASETAPRLAKGGPGLANDLRRVRQVHGDILTPMIGEKGFDHMIEMGNLVNTPEGKEAVQGLIKNVAAAYKRHFLNIFGLGGPVGLLYHGAKALGVGTAAAEMGTATVLGTRKYVLNRMATDPDFAMRMIYAAKNRVSPRIAAPLLAGMLTSSMRDTEPESADADSQ